MFYCFLSIYKFSQKASAFFKVNISFNIKYILQKEMRASGTIGQTNLTRVYLTWLTVCWENNNILYCFLLLVRLTLTIVQLNLYLHAINLHVIYFLLLYCTPWKQCSQICSFPEGLSILGIKKQNKKFHLLNLARHVIKTQ